MTTSLDSPLLLNCVPQCYSWGKIGADSLIARLLPAYDVNVPYAELWAGAHPKAPSTANIAGNALTLDALIRQDPAGILGAHIAARFGNQLPFLFKVLSVGHALSIQAHPDKVLAEKLHCRAPEHYPDSNHKPELAIALTTMELLYGFKNIPAIAADFAALPPLQHLIGDTLAGRLAREKEKSNPELLKEIYRRIVASERGERDRHGGELISTLRAKQPRTSLEQLVIGFSELYGVSDIGIFSCFLLNYVILNPGEGVFVASNIPHAYLKGDLVECMANSDNVVRAGLTPKFQDIETLVEMLNYESAPLIPINAAPAAGSARIYRTPAAEFEVAELTGALEYTFDTNGKAVLLFCLEGRGSAAAKSDPLTLQAGSAVFIPASVDRVCVSTPAASRFFRVTVP